MRQVKGNHRGVEHPIAEDSAGSGDTRHRLHHTPLPKREFPFKSQMNPHNIGSGDPGDEARDDRGIGQTMPSDGSC